MVTFDGEEPAAVHSGWGDDRDIMEGLKNFREGSNRASPYSFCFQWSMTALLIKHFNNSNTIVSKIFIDCLVIFAVILKDSKIWNDVTLDGMAD